MEVRVEDGDRLHRPAELAGKLYRPLQSTERLRRAVHGDDDVLERGAVEVFDDQGVRVGDAPHDALGNGSEHRVPDGGHAHRADNDQVVVAVVHVLDDDLEVLALQGAADELHVVLLTERFQDVYVGVGDDLQPFCDELVVDLALPLHLVFVAELLREPRLHLPEAHVVHLGGVGVAAGDPSAELARHVDADDARLVGVIRVVYRDVDLFVHIPALLAYRTLAKIRQFARGEVAPPRACNLPCNGSCSK